MLRGTVLGVLAVASALSTVAPVAHASTGYRYWSYWNAAPDTNSWVYATQGSGTHVPDDGAVEGWRFGVAGEASWVQPEALPDFAAICGEIPAPADGKRVAVVIDPGEVAQAPAGETPTATRSECVTAQAGATGLQILQSITDVRLDAGFVCGIDGYPADECAPLVDTRMPSSDIVDATASTEISQTAEINDTAQDSARSSTDTPSMGSPLLTAAFTSLLALFGFGIWRRSRRSRV